MKIDVSPYAALSFVGVFLLTGFGSLSGSLSPRPAAAQSGAHSPHGEAAASAATFEQRSEAPVHAPPAAGRDTPSFIVVAPELGERRDAEVRRLFERFSESVPKSVLVTVPSADGHGNEASADTPSDVDRSPGVHALVSAVDGFLVEDPDGQIVILPLFLAPDDPDLDVPVNEALESLPEVDRDRVRSTPTFGESYLSKAAGVPDGPAHPNMLRWMLRSAFEHMPVTAAETGVILMPHGADDEWNRAMREATAGLGDRYVTVDAYSMANPAVLEPAIRELERRGMKAAVVVRIFTMESSFRAKTEYMLGLRNEAPYPGIARIPTHLRIATVGGMEAHPLLAEAMADRASEISTNPEDETLILVGHGMGDDAADARWIRNLERIGELIQQAADTPYRDVKVGTWREDWPDKRDAAVEDLRQKVAAAAASGSALVIPVRTIGHGPEARLLDGLDFRLGQGFAPHPNFERWLTWEIEEGLAELRNPAKR